MNRPRTDRAASKAASPSPHHHKHAYLPFTELMGFHGCEIPFYACGTTNPKGADPIFPVFQL